MNSLLASSITENRFPGRSGADPRGAPGNAYVDEGEVPQGDRRATVTLMEPAVPGTQDREGLATLGRVRHR